MATKSSQWSKDVKKAVIDQDMTIKRLAETIGYSVATVSQVINGRYSKTTCKVIVDKINETLGIDGMPERTDTPSDEWCQEVKIALVKHGMSVNKLAENVGVTRDRLSLVINGKMMNTEIVTSVNDLLGISIPAVTCDS